MKNAKKSMFITTILMVAVLIVAVSTATFAWYTASTTANSNAVTLSSAESQSANIAVGWVDSADTATITLAAPATGVTYNPTAPKTKFTVGDSYAAAAFYTAGIDANKNFTSAGVSSTPFQATNPETETDHDFFVINNNANSGVTVRMACDIEGDLANQIVVAVYVDGKFSAIFTNIAAGYTYGEITGPVTVEEVTTQQAASSLSKDSSLTATYVDIPLEAKVADGTDHYETVSFYAWLDGSATQDAQAGKTVSIKFNFTVAPEAGD